MTGLPCRLFGRQRPIRSVLGGGKVADLLLWKDKKVSATLLIGVTTIWFLFEVAEYNLVTLLCHLSITLMLIAFIWCNAAEFFQWKKPKIPELLLHESTFREAASTFHIRFNMVLSKFFDIANGKDPALFFLMILFLYILSVIGTYFSFVNLLALSFVGMLLIPYLYDRYEDEVDILAAKMMRKLKKFYRRLDSNVLDKIPRGTAKEKKHE